ncbi:MULTISPECIES: UbiA family prenyltransferase [unclassified Frankia]|uniref:UbiA family prenyltransferase n=1 Tax=unclassified Frankia TaxID=2632575 RepID=UPI0006DC799A|nr:MULTISPECIES: UbiA family prenyltransferase [unclassified Frankia]KQC35331.1 4-hydroxybenzoate polyprenyltransferase [Frankia sp. ACN1ag]KQM02589.1 UbiA prenyltransferase family protein [Frankia sp. CpI1-P]
MGSRAAGHPAGRTGTARRHRTAVRRLVDVWALTRPGTALADAVPFAAGGLAAADPRVGAVLLLVLAGVLVSVFGRLLDAVAGLDADRINPVRRDSPLVQGRLAPGWVAGWAALAGAAVVGGGWLWAASLPARIGFVAVIGLRAWLALSRWRVGGGPSLRRLLAAATLAGGLPLGVAATGGDVGVGAGVLTAGFGLATIVAGWTVADLRDLPTDRVCGRRTPALATGVHLRRPRGFVLPRRYVAIVLTAQVGIVAVVSVASGLALTADADGAATLPAVPRGPAAVAPVTPGPPGGHVSLAGRGLAAAAAVLAALVATAGLIRLVRSGAPGLDPIRSPRPRGGGFVLANLLACQLASVAWLLTEPAGLPLWALLPALGGWAVGLPLRLLAERDGVGFASVRAVGAPGLPALPAGSTANGSAPGGSRQDDGERPTSR